MQEVPRVKWLDSHWDHGVRNHGTIGHTTEGIAERSCKMNGWIYNTKPPDRQAYNTKRGAGGIDS
jgi:hypothetical protein